MGCFQSKSVEDLEAKAVNDKIEGQLKKDKQLLRNEIKMLLLGAGESGKSTVLKQMKLIHQGTYSPLERKAYKEVIWSNTVQSMQVVLDAMESMGMELGTEQCGHWADRILELPEEISGEVGPGLGMNNADGDKRMPAPIGEAIWGLWNDAGVKACVERSKEFQLNDSASYYFENIQRIAGNDYLPTDQDILRSRVKTTGITETTFKIGQLSYRMFDVGGQRSERRKWIHCFESVTVLVFMVAISEYDQMLYEDESVNRMTEALSLFDSIANSRWFEQTSVILFLNKIDLFKLKLEQSPLNVPFPDYRGNNDFRSSSEFILQKFSKIYRGPNGLYHHFTCATDTRQIAVVLSAVNEHIVQSNLKDAGMV